MTTEQQEDKRWQKNAVSPLLPAERHGEKGHMNHLQNHLLHCVSGHSSLIAMHYWSPFSFFFELATLLYCLINSHLIPSAKRLTSIISYFPISLVGIGTSAGRVELEYVTVLQQIRHPICVFSRQPLQQWQIVLRCWYLLKVMRGQSVIKHTNEDTYVMLWIAKLLHVTF